MFPIVFGLGMGIATVFAIPSTVEPYFWLAIFFVCANVIAKRCSSRFFLHGLAVSMVNSVWVTASHVLLFDQYIANHRQEAEMMASMSPFNSPRLMMILVGPVIGIASGLVLGTFAFADAEIVRRLAARRAAHNRRTKERETP